jgi:hypothetical protein
MHDLSFVMQRIAAGDRVYFSYDFYGKVWITVSRGWIFKRKTRVSLPARSRVLTTRCTRATRDRP